MTELPLVTALLIGTSSGIDVTCAGRPAQHGHDPVDAALLSLERREMVRMAAPHDKTQWQRFDTAHRAIAPSLSSQQLAARDATLH